MIAGDAALCPGVAWHARSEPVENEFEQRVSYAWLDPDHPEGLTDGHPLWSCRRPSPARFRAADYGTGGPTSLARQVRDDIAEALGTTPTGSIRMLTQIRRWGWLFNPITVYVAWGDDPATPVAVVLEVTNTPWKERHRYVAALDSNLDGSRFSAEVRKVLHVSPFLDESQRYRLVIASGNDESSPIDLSIDVLDAESGEPVIRTMLSVERRRADRRSLRAALLTPLPTHRVSAGIHIQAARLWRKGAPFIAHPRKRGVEA